MWLNTCEKSTRESVQMSGNTVSKDRDVICFHTSFRRASLLFIHSLEPQVLKKRREAVIFQSLKRVDHTKFFAVICSRVHWNSLLDMPRNVLTRIGRTYIFVRNNLPIHHMSSISNEKPIWALPNHLRVTQTHWTWRSYKRLLRLFHSWYMGSRKIGVITLGCPCVFTKLRAQQSQDFRFNIA